jgi:hypothetical protein
MERPEGFDWEEDDDVLSPPKGLACAIVMSIALWWGLFVLCRITIRFLDQHLLIAEWCIGCMFVVVSTMWLTHAVIRATPADPPHVSRIPAPTSDT